MTVLNLLNLKSLKNFLIENYPLDNCLTTLTCDQWGASIPLFCILLRMRRSRVRLVGVASRREEKQSQNLQLRLSLCDCLSATRTCVRRSSSLRDALAFAMTVILSLENKNWDAPLQINTIYVYL